MDETCSSVVVYVHTSAIQEQKQLWREEQCSATQLDVFKDRNLKHSVSNL